MVIFIQGGIMNANIIGLVVSLIFAVIIIAGFLVGLWRGLKRSTVSLVLSIVGVVIAFFVTPTISKAILGIQIAMDGQKLSLQEIILNLIKSIDGVDALVEKNPNLELILLNLPSAIVNVLLFIFVTIAVESLLYVLYKILAKTIFKLKPNEKKRKLAGGAIGAVKAFIVTIFAFMPFASLIGVANTCLKSGDYGIQPSVQVMTVENQSEENIDSSLLSSILPNEAVNVVKGLENNVLTKICGVFGLDNALFDYFGSFNVGEEKIYIRKEIVNVYNVVDITNQLSKIDSSYTLKDFNYKKITSEINTLSSSTLFENVLADTIGEIIINYKDYAFIRDSQFVQDYGNILDEISRGLKAYTEAGGKVSDYFTDDINSLLDVAVSLAESGAIDDIISLECLNAEGAIQVLINDDYYQTFKTALESIFNMNLVRDGAEEIAKTLSEKLSSEVDPIGVETEEWKDEDWKALANSVASVAKRYGNISKEVDIMKVVSDATILLDKNENYNISSILSELGLLIDEARSINLLKTSEGKPIIDKLLNKYKLALPTLPVIQNNGSALTIENYKQHFDFISPSLVKMRDEGVYSTISAEGETNEKIIGLAEIVSKEGNETLLSEIIMPLYQVEPTKSLIIEKLTNGLNSDLMDLSTLTNYSEWKKDLDYISMMLKVLNSRKVGDDSYLSLAIAGSLSTVVDNLQEEDVDAIMKPIFYAKSTSKIKDSVLTSIQNDLRGFTADNSLSLSVEGITFDEGSEQDQFQEFCNVLKEIISIKESFEIAQNDIKKVDKALLGEMLNVMKENAYRTQIASKIEEGIFNSAFKSIMNKLKTEYSAEISLLEMDPDTLEENIGARNFNEENYHKIDFSKLMTLLASIEE